MAHNRQPQSRPHRDRRDGVNIKRMLPYLACYRGRALLALACLVFAKGANVGIPVVLKEIVDGLQQEVVTLVLPVSLLLIYGLLRLSSSLFNELRDVVFARVRYRAMRQLATQVLSHLHELSLGFHLSRKTGAISRDLERGTRSVSSILNYLVFSIIPMLVEFALVAIILLSQYDWVFTVVTFSTVGVFLIFTFTVTEWRMDYRLTMNRLESQANSQAVDSLINYETVKYFGNEQLEFNRFDQSQADWEEAAVKSQGTMSILNFGQSVIIATGVTGIMFFATDGVVKGEMTIGDLVLVNAFLLQLFIPLNFLGMVYRQIKYGLADMDLIFKLMEQEPEVQDSDDAASLQLSGGMVRFEGVGFAYQTDRQILKEVDFTIPAGNKVAIVGHSGSGKSTIARLLFRFYDTTSGRVTVDGQDLRGITQASLRSVIGVVPQDTVLFNETIYYNLAYGRPSATQQEVETAASMAHISDFIDSLPQGYETRVGERGLKLSGGEKQRIAIARAILKQPRILIFDEATSSLDSKTEQAIQETLKEVSENHTTLVIAHRLSTVVDADQILVMEQGSIVEQGNHQELLSAGGLYYDMWLLQQQERDQQEGVE